MGLKIQGLRYPTTHFQAQESDDFIGHCQINHPLAENFLCNEFERDLEMSQTGQEFEENVYCDADPNSDEIILEQIDDSAQEEFCQNQEDTAFEDPLENSSQNLSENNDLSIQGQSWQTVLGFFLN